MPIGRIDSAIELALEHGVILCTYADTMRVPASKGLSLMKAKAQGGDIRMIYSAADCLDIARANPDRNVVFFAIGFETTTPATAVVLKQAKAEGLKNFFVFCNHVLTPPAMRHILKNQEKSKLKVLSDRLMFLRSSAASLMKRSPKTIPSRLLSLVSSLWICFSLF